MNGGGITSNPLSLPSKAQTPKVVVPKKGDSPPGAVTVSAVAMSKSGSAIHPPPIAVSATFSEQLSERFDAPGQQQQNVSAVEREIPELKSIRNLLADEKLLQKIAMVKSPDGEQLRLNLPQVVAMLKADDQTTSLAKTIESSKLKADRLFGGIRAHRDKMVGFLNVLE